MATACGAAADFPICNTEIVKVSFANVIVGERWEFAGGWQLYDQVLLHAYSPLWSGGLHELKLPCALS